MFTMLIVDDEKEEREGISFLLGELGFVLHLAFAANGKQALEYLAVHEVDILFTDIRMPILDGLELTKLAKTHKPDLKVILYSGYSDFAYAKKAINLGVSEYILKPVNIDEFQSAIENVIAAVETDLQKKRLLSENAAFAKKHLLYQAINYPSFLLEDHPLCTRLFLLEFDKDFFDMVSFDFEEEISHLLNVPMDYLNLNMCQSVLLFYEKESSMECSFYNIASLIHDWITEHFTCSCYIAISPDLKDNVYLSDVFVGLERLIEYRFFIPDTFLFEESRLLSDYLTTEYTDTQLLAYIEKDLKHKDFVHLHLHLNLLFQKYQSNLNYSQLYIKFIFATLYKSIITEYDDLPEMELNRSIDRLYRSNDLHEVKKLMQETILELEKKHGKRENIWHDIELIKDYIEHHYGEDLDLAILAEKVYLSPTYLCTRFKQAAGFGINKYIKTVRMEKAKELLTNTNIKVIDICTQVGFRSLSYFCQNFREYTGETPEKYRKQNFSIHHP